MSDAPDPLERELAALRPRPVSPELRRRVGNRLGARRRWAWGLALAGVLAAAGAVALVAPWKKDPAPPVVPTVAPPVPPAVPEPDSQVRAWQEPSEFQRRGMIASSDPSVMRRLRFCHLYLSLPPHSTGSPG